MNGNKRKKIISAAITLFITAVAVSGILYLLWNGGCLLPLWINWENSALSDTSHEYQATLRRKKVTLNYDTNVIWTSPLNIKVQSAAFADIDKDGNDELILLCWKVGRFGENRPFWIKKDEKQWSQHIFIYSLNAGKIKPKWMSSYIGQDVSAMTVTDRLLLTDLSGNTSCWIWNSWGFTKATSKTG